MCANSIPQVQDMSDSLSRLKLNLCSMHNCTRFDVILWIISTSMHKALDDLILWLLINISSTPVLLNKCVNCVWKLYHKEIEISLPILKFQKNSSTISDLVYLLELVNPVER